MFEDQQSQLLRRIQYLKRALILNIGDYQENQSAYDAVIEKLYSMVRNNEISTYLGIDSVYYYLIDKIQEGKRDIDKYALEIKELLA